MLDTLQRRIRFSPPQPRGNRIRLGTDDLAVFQAIHRHGHLPSHYLRAFTSYTNQNAFADRLTLLYNGSETNGPYLTRPQRQYNSFFADVQHLVYDLNKQSAKLIEPSPFSRNDNHFVHTLMNACVGASIELACIKHGLTYIPRHEVLSRKGNPMRLPLGTDKHGKEKYLVPDDLFGIKSAAGYQFFAVEVDRHSESYHRDEIPNQKQPPTIEKKFLDYLSVMDYPPKGVLYRYKEVWDIPNLMVLFVTVDEDWAKKLMTEVNRLKPRLAERFLFNVCPDFGPAWRVPKEILDLQTWESVKGKFDITTP